MPFCTSLIKHNPRVLDLFECLENEDREHEHLARIIRNNTETRGMLYTPIDKLVSFSKNELDQLMCEYNKRLYYKHKQERCLEKFKEHLYLNGYKSDVISIINSLKNYTEQGYQDYKPLVDNFLNTSNHGIDCEEKKDLLKDAFLTSTALCVYGSAGTGKTRFIEHLSDLFKNLNQTFLANTNTAVENLRRRIPEHRDPSANFQTIAKFLQKSALINTDLLVIDECSTVSNKDMKALLDVAEFSILVLVGDIYQIESIRFGNWFSIAKQSLPEHSIMELTEPYRTNDKNLLNLWNKVRNGKSDITEHISHNGYSVEISKDLFSTKNYIQNDEIILCLNYGGLYGVNNINTFLQTTNNNQSYQWGTKVYKIEDPILFNENQQLCPAIHNNCKGIIRDIEHNNNQIIFTIEADIILSPNDITNLAINLVKQNKHTSTVKITIDQHKSTDNDDDYSNQVPFHIAYAVSIHKAQGLEYDSVKVVISDEAEEQITHNIFYTAITRTRKCLKIYWSAETQNSILNRIGENNSSMEDWHLLSLDKN